jgi:hypothetical protein
MRFFIELYHCAEWRAARLKRVHGASRGLPQGLSDLWGVLIKEFTGVFLLAGMNGIHTDAGRRRMAIGMNAQGLGNRNAVNWVSP